MAVGKQKGAWYVYFMPFKGHRIGIKLDVRTKREAEEIEGVIRRACRTANYSNLDPVSREACIRMFRNKRWELPPDLGGSAVPQEELALWTACELFLKYPEVRNKPCRERYEMCLLHIVNHFGKDVPVKSIWVPQVKQYQMERRNAGASASTVNWEKSTLSRLFQVLIELQHVDANPCRLVRNLSQKSGERQVYLSSATVHAIAERCPEWYQPLLWTAFYTGMRRGEILGLLRKQVRLAQRMIYLGPEDTKEGHWKRVPIHRELVPIVQAVLQGASLIGGRVFSLHDRKGVRDLELESFKNVWPRVCDALDLQEPLPRFHDLRHTWRTNARRSGVDPQIAESIMGHWFKGKSVNDRYGYVSDAELLAAVDKMTFDHGETRIFCSGRNNPNERYKKSTSEGSEKEKRSCATRTLSIEIFGGDEGI
jgi:integrase